MKQLRQKSFGLLLALTTTAVAGCAEDDTRSKTDDETENVKTTEERMQELFESILDGVQLIESAESIPKTATEPDLSTAPATYQVTYAGCAPGHVAGQMCVDAGRQVVAIITEQTHIIQSVDQTYNLAEFSSVPDYTMSGSLGSHVDVTVDTTTESTTIHGTANGTITVSGELEGQVEVALTVGGGRNYTESAATPITVAGTLTYEGKTYPVDGGFQRE